MPSNKIPWARVLVEGVVIVGSILLAFALDAWWDRQSRDGDLREQAEVVVGEMAASSYVLRRIRDMHDWKAQLAGHLTETLRGIPEGATVVVSDTLVGPLIPQLTADVNTRPVEIFIAAGGLELLDDEATRGDVLFWTRQVEDLRDDELYLRNFAAADLTSHLRANYAVANAERWSVGMVQARSPRNAPLDPALLGTVTLRHEQQLLNLLAARESQERALVSGLALMIEQAERIQAGLEQLR